MTKIIAFTGFKGVGKSTAARLAREEINRTRCPGDPFAVVRSFASPLKATCRDLFDLSYEQVHGDQKEVVDPRYGMTPRQILQDVGTMYREHFGTDFWVNALGRQRQKSESTIIDDCRYPNEAEWAQKNGGIVIGLRRADHGLDDDHPSETQMRDQWETMIDYEIVTSSVPAMEQEIAEILADYEVGI